MGGYMKIKIGIFLIVLFLFAIIGIPNLSQSVGNWKEYQRVNTLNATLREQQQTINQKKSRILNNVNAELGYNSGDPAVVTSAVEKINGVVIKKIVAKRWDKGKEETIATLEKSNEVEQLPKNIDILEYTIKTTQKQIPSTVLAIEKLKLDYEKLTLMVPNGLLHIRIRFYGGGS